jgi:chitodextrinase
VPDAVVAASDAALPPSEAPVSPAVPAPVSPVPVAAGVAAMAAVAAADAGTTGANEVIAAVVDEPAAAAALTTAPADITSGPAPVAAPVPATAPVAAPRVAGRAAPVTPLSPPKPPKTRRGKITAVRPPTGSTQSSATDIYAPVGSAALIVEAEWAKIAAAVAERNPPVAKSGILRRLDRRGRLVTAGAVTVVFALVILTLSTGWLGGKSEASPNSNPNVPNFSHSAIVIPGPSIPVPAPSSPTRDNEKPTQPTGLHVISRSQTAVSLDWNASADNIGVMGYIVMRAGKTVGTTYDPGFTDTGLTANSSYHYTVEAFDKAGNKSAVSGTASATTLVAPDTAPPSVPTGLHKTSVSVSTIGLDWSPSHDNIGVAGYDVFRDGRQIATVTKTSYIDKGLTAKATHSYYVRAFDASNNESASSRSVSATTLAQKDTSPPTAPRNLHAVSVSDTAITIGWSASTDNTGVSGYIVTRNGSTFPQISGLLFSDPGLHESTTYNYSVVAVDGSGNKSTPATLPVTTNATPPTPTPTPTPTDTGTPDPTPSATESSPPPPPPPAVGGVTANVGSVDATDPANCTVTISVTVRVDNGDLPSGPMVHWSGSGIGSGDVGGSYTEGSNNFSIGTFPVTVDGSVTVTIDGFSDSGSWNAPAACNAPTDPPTTDTPTP